jgi:hypothetical protein
MVIVINNINEQVNSFNYLGCTITVSNNRGLEMKVNRCNQMFSIIQRTLNDKTRKETQIKFYEAMAVPTLNYRSEILTVTKKQEAKTETAEMKILRSVAGYIRKNQIQNIKIREELNIFNLNAKSIKSRSQWKNHVQRMEDRRIPKKILTYNPRKKRNIGRPQLRCRDQHTLQENGTDHIWPNP